MSVRKITPEELTDGFERLGLEEGSQVIMHASLKQIGDVDGGAAMVIHRLMKVIGTAGTLLMPAFTSISRHSMTHDNFTKPGCWCEGKESRHVPFIPELQPDKALGEIAHRLCSWPSSKRSRHPAYSFVSTGRETDNLIRSSSLSDPLQPLKTFLRNDPLVLTIGVGFDSVFAVHLTEQHLLPSKFPNERALTVAARGQAWVDILGVGCSNGFVNLEKQLDGTDFRQTQIGSARSCLYSMKTLSKKADELLNNDPSALSCGRAECLSCSHASRKD